MQTSTIEVSRPLFESKEHYQAFRQAWKETANSEYELECSHFALYALLRGRDYRKCFTAITNKNKLANGGDSDYADAKKIAERRIKGLVKRLENPTKKFYDGQTYLESVEEFLSPFKGTVTTEMLIEVSNDLD